MSEERTPAGVPQLEPVSALWRVFSAPPTLLLLMAALALVLALTAWIPQIPAQASGDPQAWLAQQPGFLGQSTGLVRALGLYDLYHALWFRLLLALLALALFVRLVDAADLAWQTRSLRAGRARPARLFPPWQAPSAALKVVSLLPLEEVQERVQGFLAHDGLDLSQVAGLPAPTLTAGRRSLALAVRAAGYGALLLALAGLFFTGTWGWQSAPIQVVPGESRAVGHDTPYAFRLDAFRMQIGRQGSLAGYESQVTWLRDQQPAGEGIVTVGRPARVAGIALHQIGFVPLLKVRGSDSTGRPLILQSGSTDLQGAEEVEVRFASPGDQPLLFLPDLDRFLALVFEPMCNSGRPAVHVDLLDEGGAGRQRLASLSQSGEASFDGVALSVQVTYLPLLRLDSRPVMGLTLIAAGLALLALAAAWAIPVRLVSVALLPGEEGVVQVELTTLPGARQREWLVRLADGLREVLADER